jgi:hypothetical protein
MANRLNASMKRNNGAKVQRREEQGIRNQTS